MTAWQPPTDAKGILGLWLMGEHSSVYPLQGTSAERRALCEEMIPMLVNNLMPLRVRGPVNAILRLALELARTADGDAP